MRTVREIFLVAGKLVASCVVLSVPLAFLMLVVNYMRTFGLPSDIAAATSQALTNSSFTGLYFWMDQVIAWYNAVFPGYARFGSGLGILIAAFWTLNEVRSASVVTRLVGGLMCGAVIGGRSALMVSSSPRFVLTGIIIGSIGGAAYLIFSGRPSPFQPLPRLHLAGEVVE